MMKSAASEAAFKCGRSRLARKKAKGSSIVEMLVAIFVLMMVLLSMVGMFMISRTAIYNKEDETANAVALSYIEELEGLPFDKLSELSSVPPRRFGKYNATAQVVSSDYSATVHVEVQWEAAALGRRTLRLERMISAGGHKNVGERK
jgi:Tfp pilus assembly protein PilV